MTNAQAIPAPTATPTTPLMLVGTAFEARHGDLLKRFDSCIQELLESPLEAARVLEWTKFRSFPASA